MALVVQMSVADTNGLNQIAGISIVRGEAHGKLPHHFCYSYKANCDGKRYIGNVLHNYNSGAFALTQKVTKAIVAQQKAEKA
jgi:hypothetical protein